MDAEVVKVGAIVEGGHSDTVPNFLALKRVSASNYPCKRCLSKYLKALFSTKCCVDMTLWPVTAIRKRSERIKAALDAADALIGKHGDRDYGISRDHVIAALQAGDNYKRIKWTEIRRILRQRLGRHP